MRYKIKDEGKTKEQLIDELATLRQRIAELEAVEIQHQEGEKFLRESEERYRHLFENIPTGVYRTTPDGRILMANLALIQMLGYRSFDELASHNLEKEGGFQPIHYRKQFKELLEQRGEVIGLESQWMKLDGTPIFIRENARAIRGEDGAVLYYEGTVEDITERKRTEEALGENIAQLSKKNRYETIVSAVTRSVHQSINLQDVLENSVETMKQNIDEADNISIYLVEGEEAVLKAYRGYPDWWVKRVGRIPHSKGFTWKTIIEGKPRYCADVDQDTVIGPAGRELGTKSYASMPIRYQGKTVGTININSLQKNAFDEEELNLLGTVAQQIEIAINNAKQAEALQKAKEELELRVYDRTKELIDINKELTRGIMDRERAKEILRKRTEQVLHHQRVLLKLAKMDNSDLDSALKRITDADSKTLGVERVSVWLFNEDRSSIICKDLYKLSEGIHESGLSFRAKEYPSYFQALEESRILAANDAWIDPRTREYAEGYLKPLGITSMMDVPIRLHGNVVGVVCHEHVGVMREWTTEEQDFAASIADMVSLALEASERGRAEEQVRASLKEKEVLLKEIHHRVKNNLQIIHSLLNLQSSRINDLQTREELKEIQNRIKSMALIHETHYQSKDLVRIDFAEYIKKLSDHLMRSYGMNSKDIKLNIYADNILLSVDKAIPCGLIINEIVSNSLKHAFPVRKRGKVSIIFRSEGKSPIAPGKSQKRTNNNLVLIISNNGVKFPKNLDFRNTESLGLQLVCALTDQLKGTVELDTSGGTEFKITFPA